MSEEKSIKKISPHDNNFPVLFLKRELERYMRKTEKLIANAYNEIIRVSPAASQIRQALDKGSRLVVDADRKTLDDIKKGIIKLSFEKGRTVGQIRKENGEFGSKLGVKWEDYRKGIDPVKFSEALQMQSLQAQIEAMSEQISHINQNVGKVLQGQQNDRISLYYSGLALYLESCSVSDNTLKNQIRTQALSVLSQACFQLKLNLETEIRSIADREHLQLKGRQAKSLEETIHSIEQGFQFIHQASILRAAIYCHQGELSAMSTVLKEYSSFIASDIVPNAELLAQADKTDSGLENGKWKSRKNLQLDVPEMSKKLHSSKETVYYLGLSERGEENV